MKLAVVLLFLGSLGQAATTTVPAASFGFYHNNGTFTSSTNHAIGYYTGNPPGELRNFFTFNLTGLAGKITAAKLRAFNPASGFSSPDPTETYTLFDVSTPLNTLTTLTGGTAAFSDLGSGTQLGSVTVSNSANGTIVEVNLNAAGIAYLNSVNGTIAIGGAITTLTSGGQSERLFNSASGVMVRELVVTYNDAPVPCTFALSQSMLSLPVGGGGAPVNLNNPTGDNCQWTSAYASNWITLSPASGTGSTTINITAAANPSASQRSVTITIAGQTLTVTQAGIGAANGTPLRFVSMTPCRLVETRADYNYEGRTGTFGPPFFNAGETRTFVPQNSSICTVPAAAKAFVLNVTLAPKGNVDFVTVYPAGEARPDYWTVRSPDGLIVANSAIVRAGTGGGLSMYSSHSTDIIIDISGYFTDDTSLSNLVFYPLTPCRVIETRAAYRPQAGQFGPPSLAAKQTRTFNFPQSTDCQIPAGAAAYSVTITVAPPGALPFLTAWPAGSSQPNVSSINSPNGRILANSVILPAGPGGAINLYAFEATDVIVDINGYFAADNGTGLFYYPVTQCRIANSNDSSFTSPYGGPIYGDTTKRTIPVAASNRCSGIAADAKAYSLNATVIPNGNSMPFLTVWPTGQAQPNASIINAFQGQTVSSGFLVPTGTNGSVDIYAYRATHVALEISGYFGR
ncbi:MAG: BACON domain-containing protein [Acidobacteria bacterium]|nr:BACON domain-containing protein [Acidobacteriota bacterium]